MVHSSTTVKEEVLWIRIPIILVTWIPIQIRIRLK
jgi:hypothetical protein